MRSRLLFMLMFIFTASAFAQNSNLVLFSEQGERFFVVLNGIRQNAAPETNVKITELNQPTYKVKVIFEDKTIADLDKNVFLEPGTEFVLNIKKNNKGLYVLRLLSQTPIADAPPTPAQHQSVVTYTNTPPPLTTVTTTTTTTTGTTPTGNVSVGMNVGGVGINMTVNDNTMHTGTTTTTTYTETVETTHHGHPHPHPHGNPAPTPPPSYLPGYNGPIGCPVPMSPMDFEGVRNSISSKSFEDSKLQVAKQVCGSNCLLASQVREIMMLFTFENTRLDFAKFAYRKTYDIGNYYKVNDAFQFESSIDDLNRSIGNR